LTITSNDHWSLRVGYTHTMGDADKNSGQVFGVENVTTHNQSRRINSQFINQVADVAQSICWAKFKTGPFNHQILAGAQYTRSDTDLLQVIQNITPNFVNVDNPTYNYT